MRHHVLIIAILALEVFAMGYGTGNWMLPVILGFPVLVPALGGYRLPVQRVHRYRFVIALGIIWVLLWRFLPSSGDAPFSMPFDYEMLYAFAGFCLSTQVFLACASPSFLDDAPHRRVRWIFWGIACVAAATNFETRGDELRVLSALYAAYTVLVALFLWGRVEWPRRPRFRLAALGLVLALAAVVLGGVGTAHVLRVNVLKLDLALGKMGVRAAKPGLPSQGGLHTITDAKDRHRLSPLLQAEADQAPGYLRGYVFDRFEGMRWLPSDARTRRPLPPAKDKLLAPPAAGYDWYRVQDRQVPDRYLSIWLEQPSRTLLVPEDTACISAPFGGVIRDSAGMFTTRERELEMYRVARAAAPIMNDDPVLPEHTEVPVALDPRVKTLADSLFANATSNDEKARAVLGYFKGNYQYALGYVPPSGVHGLSHFLLEQPDAHCEYFATGAVTLLRLGGVPARYVTGVVVTEKNPVSGLWVARGQDAHAWPEVWDPGRGWHPIEPTPGGAGEGDTISYRQYLAEAGAHNWRRAWNALQQNAWAAIQHALIAGGTFLFISWPGRVLIALIALVVIWRLRRRLRKRNPPAAAETNTALERLLKQADRHARRLNLSRDAHETLLQFARHIEREQGDGHALAQWYREYAAVRYQAEAPTEKILKQLGSKLRDNGAH